MKYSTILVDIDDTIWDTRNNSRKTFEELFNNYQWDKYFESFDQFYDSYMSINIQLWRMYAQGKIQKDKLIVERFIQPFAPYFAMNDETAKNLNDEFLEMTSQRTGLVENAKELLDYLAPKYQLMILSNGFKEVQYKKLKNSGLDKYFCHVVLSDEAGVNKPHPGIFQKAMQLANSNTAETIMLGDSFESDICGAHNSQIDQIWFNPDHNQPTGFEPTFEVSKLEEVMNIL